MKHPQGWSKIDVMIICLLSVLIILKVVIKWLSGHLTPFSSPLSPYLTLCPSPPLPINVPLPLFPYIHLFPFLFLSSSNLTPYPSPPFSPSSHTVPSVFILYNKEESVGVTAEKYCDEVWALTELLHQIGGLTCEIDVLDKNGVVANWNVWTEQKIRESMFVVLVCSPTIAAACAHPEHKPISTLKGAFYADTIVNLIAAPKFIPVFLNRLPTDIYQWMPTNLHTATRYHINVEAFTERLGDTEGMLQVEFHQRLERLLEEEQFASIARLLAQLRGVQLYSCPAQFANPVKLPSTLSRKDVCNT